MPQLAQPPLIYSLPVSILLSLYQLLPVPCMSDLHEPLVPQTRDYVVAHLLAVRSIKHILILFNQVVKFRDCHEYV